ncbi:MAG: hypothetical protein MHMPM18_001740 [Marteilia pararefringens]
MNNQHYWFLRLQVTHWMLHQTLVPIAFQSIGSIALLLVGCMQPHRVVVSDHERLRMMISQFRNDAVCFSATAQNAVPQTICQPLQPFWTAEVVKPPF